MTSVRIEELKLRITRSKTNVKSNIEEEFRKKGFEFTTCNTNEAKNEEVFKEQNDKGNFFVMR